MRGRQRWYVYIVQCADGSLYTGVARNLKRRISVHNSGRGAKYTRSRTPVTLLWREWRMSQGAALRREHQIKQLSRAGKRLLVETQPTHNRGALEWLQSMKPVQP